MPICIRVRAVGAIGWHACRIGRTCSPVEVVFSHRLREITIALYPVVLSADRLAPVMATRWKITTQKTLFSVLFSYRQEKGLNVSRGRAGQTGAEQYAAHFVTGLLNCGGHGNDQVRRRNLSASRLDSSNQPDDLTPPSGAQRQLDC